MRSAPSPARSSSHAPSRLPSLVFAALAAVVTLGACRASNDGQSAVPAASAAGTPPAQAANGETVAANVAQTTPGAMALPSDSMALRAAADAGRIVGAPTAKVWLIIASDFQCPYCKLWHDGTYEALRRDYVETGKVRMAYLNYPLDQHAQAMPAAEAAMCAAAQNRFWEYHSALFRSQESWGKAGDMSATFDAMAAATGLDVGRFRSCTRSHVMRAVILADQDRMASRGVQSTPSFFVGNQVVAGAQPLDTFRRLLDGALAQPTR